MLSTWPPKDLEFLLPSVLEMGQVCDDGSSLRSECFLILAVACPLFFGVCCHTRRLISVSLFSYKERCMANSKSHISLNSICGREDGKISSESLSLSH